MTRTCERCSGTFGTKQMDRYCKDCRKVVKQEMKAAGYLQSVPWRRASGDGYGTHSGEEFSPSGENAMRALEGD